MRLCLVEDLGVAGLEPLTLTRPMYELWLGCSTLGSKIAGAFGVGPGPQRRGAVIRSHLVAVQRQRDPHVVVNDRDWLARGPLVVVNARWVPPADFRGSGRSRTFPRVLRRPARLCPGRSRRALWGSIRTRSIPGSTGLPRVRRALKWAASGWLGPGTWLPETALTSSAISRKPAAPA